MTPPYEWPTRWAPSPSSGASSSACSSKSIRSSSGPADSRRGSATTSSNRPRRGLDGRQRAGPLPTLPWTRTTRTGPILHEQSPPKTRQLSRFRCHKVWYARRRWSPAPVRPSSRPGPARCSGSDRRKRRRRRARRLGRRLGRPRDPRRRLCRHSPRACSPSTCATGTRFDPRRRSSERRGPTPAAAGSRARGGALVIVLALPLFLVAGWPLAGWAVAAVLWVGVQAFGLLLAR